MTTSILRAAILLTLALSAFTTMCMNPATPTAQTITGAIGLVSFAAITILYPRWSKTDRIISAYHRWASKGIRE